VDAIGLLGIPEAETRLIRNVVTVARTRGLRYEIVANIPPATCSGIVVVNADDPVAARAWTAIKGARTDLSGLAITSLPTAAACPAERELKRPFRALDFMRALGEIDILRRRHANLAKERAAADGNGSSRASQRFSGCILVVDDSATIRRQLQRLLSDHGAEVEVAENGELALHLIATRKIDLVLLDVVMPGADGYHICKTIKRNRTRKALPVVMLTSKSSPFDRVRGSLAGCDSYITKPTNSSRIQEVLGKYLG
jgi:twitching motility two-component system response regulator PilG